MIKKTTAEDTPNRLVNFAMYFAGGIRNLIRDNLGKRFNFLGPYFMILMLWLLTSVALGLFGFPVTMANYSIPLTLALVMFVLNWGFAIKDFGPKFFMKFLNPLNIAGEVSQIVSLSFRIFGNIVAGGILVGLLNYALGNMVSSIPVVGDINAVGIIVVTPMRLYFDIFAGLIQAFIFTLLTIIYIGLAVRGQDEYEELVNQKAMKKQKSQ